MLEDRKIRSAERGFTLVELMVVVAIIALLAAIVIPNYVHSRAQAAVAQSEANLKQIATALELFHTDYQQYPAGAGASVAPALFTPPQGGGDGRRSRGRQQLFEFDAHERGRAQTVSLYARRRQRYDDRILHGRRRGALRCGDSFGPAALRRNR